MTKKITVVAILMAVFLAGCGVQTKVEQPATNVTLYDCKSDAKTSVQTVSGVITKLYFAKLDENLNPADETKSATLSVKDYQSGSPKNDIFFELSRNDDGFLGGYKAYLQLCNADNKSNYQFPDAKDLMAISSDASGALYYIHNGLEPAVPGVYRADAYLYTPDGKWQLVGKMENIQINE